MADIRAGGEELGDAEDKVIVSKVDLHHQILFSLRLFVLHIIKQNPQIQITVCFRQVKAPGHRGPLRGSRRPAAQPRLCNYLTWS